MSKGAIPMAPCLEIKHNQLNDHNVAAMVMKSSNGPRSEKSAKSQVTNLNVKLKLSVDYL